MSAMCKVVWSVENTSDLEIQTGKRGSKTNEWVRKWAQAYFISKFLRHFQISVYVSKKLRITVSNSMVKL